MQTTPPFHPPPEEAEAIIRDAATWAGEEREDPKESQCPSSPEQPHTEEKRTDAEWENLGPSAMVRCAEKWNVSYHEICCYNSDVWTQCTHSGLIKHAGVHRLCRASCITMIVVCVLQAVLQAAQRGLPWRDLHPSVLLLSSFSCLCVDPGFMCY